MSYNMWDIILMKGVVISITSTCTHYKRTYVYGGGVAGSAGLSSDGACVGLLGY